MTSTRREFLWQTGGGLGGIALAAMLAGEGRTAMTHRPKVSRVIQLFMNGGVSQCDTFDRKPLLQQRHGQVFAPGVPVEAVTSTPGKILGCPFEFHRHGQSGQWVSSVFPNLAKCVDDLAMIFGLATGTNVHGPASYRMNTGFTLPGFPCMGAWLSYGLGRLSDNLPTFVVLPDPRGLPYNNLGNFSSGFLPAVHQATIIRPHLSNPLPFLQPPPSATFINPSSESAGRDLLQQMNRDHAARDPSDSRLDARIAAYELAARMQIHAPDALDVNRETKDTHRLYGLDESATAAFGRNCLTARRLIERGVRFVQVWSGAGGPSNNWDNHTSIIKELPPIATSVDRPTAGLLMDLKVRGLFEDTLVVFSTEFGRQPFSQGSEGRDHNGGTAVAWLAGAGIRGGSTAGQSDEWGWRAADTVTPHDLHATILHLLGIDHTKLTYRHNGSDRRLTDVHGHLMTGIMA